MIDNRGIDLLAQIDTALQRSAVGVGVGNLIEDQRGQLLEFHVARSHTLAENQKGCGNALFQRQTAVDGGITVYQVQRVALVIEIDADGGKIVYAAYEKNGHAGFPKSI
jgi:hypothetical protein